MTVKEVKEMINLMQEHGLTELEIEKNGFKIRLKKGISGGISSEMSGVMVQTIPAQFQAAGLIEAKAVVEDAGVYTVRSPMVGTFYSAPAPDAQSYVNQGSDVKEDDVLCIIEAMKLMNEIKCEVHGRIIEILVKNGQPIEFDQPLFKIKKA